jgi:hypothetical protein
LIAEDVSLTCFVEPSPASRYRENRPVLELWMALSLPDISFADYDAESGISLIKGSNLTSAAIDLKFACLCCGKIWILFNVYHQSNPPLVSSFVDL